MLQFYAVRRLPQELPNLPPGVEISQGFQSQQQTAGFQDMGLSMMIAIVVVYAILNLTMTNVRTIKFVAAEDLWRDVQLRARDFTVMMEHHGLGLVEHPGMTVRLHDTPGQIQRPVGRLGEANDDVLSVSPGRL